MMIMQPDSVTRELYEAAVAQVEKQKNPPALPKLRLETYHEGLSVQILHLGSFDDEGPTIARMHTEFMPASNYEPAGKHHEIYLTDPRKSAPEQNRTIIRQPVGS